MFLDADTIEECRDRIEEEKGVPASSLAFYYNGKRVADGQELDQFATLDASLVVLGGKGGFGSMLRALGTQIQKTTNKEACRDLSGRRLRDINEEKRLKNYVNNQAERERERAEKKEAKLQKLRKLVDPKCDGNGGKHEFHDPKYNEEREQATERVHDAIEAAFKSEKPATITSDSAGASPESSSEEEPQPGPSGTKRKTEVPATGPPKAKKGLWVGDGLTESDLEDSSDDEEAAA